VGVIGVGHLGSHHARIYNQMGECNLKAVFDIDPVSNAEAARRFSLPVCSGVEELLDRVEALSICTPTETHFEVARIAVGHRRHILVEKPVCASDDDAQALVELARENGVVGAVGHVERFNPAVAGVRERIGRPRFIEAHRLNQFAPRCLETNVILDLMIHDIDLVRWLVGAEPVEIRAAGVPVLSHTDDIANCRMSFPDGCIANLTASRISMTPMRKIRVFSQDHYASFDLLAKSVDSYHLFDADAHPDDQQYRTVASAEGRRIARWSAPLPTYDALEAELADFLDAIAARRAPRVTLAEGAKSLRVALAVAHACREQAAIATAPSLVPANTES
jgi:predicted dehydrogenase